MRSQARAADLDDRSTSQPLMSDTPDVAEATPIPQGTRPGNEASAANEVCNDESSAESATDVKETIHLRLVSTWWIEIITMSISFGCIAALVCILVRFQNRLLAEWSFFISINATVAIAITAARVTLLAAISVCLSQEKWTHFTKRTHRLKDFAIIDTASRGPLGSLQMLYKVSWGFASISAMVVILSLLTDTFVQQVVQLEPGTISTYQEGSATFGYAHGYKSYKSYKYESLGMDINNDINSAVLGGLQPNSRSFAFNCNSNCTWDSYYITLGFSSTCTDATKETLKTLKCSEGPQTHSITGEQGLPCTMSTPNDVQFTLAARAISKSYMNINSSELAIIDDLNGSQAFHAAVWTWEPGDDYSVDIEIPDLKTLLQNSSVIIECALGVSLYNYSDISSISNNFTIGTTKLIPLGVTTGLTTSDMLGDTHHPHQETSLWWNHTEGDMPNNYISAIDLRYASSFFQSSAFSGTIGDGTPADRTFSPGATTFFGNGTLEVVSGIFDSISQSLTDMIRQGSAMQIAQGTTSQAVVYIRVRWVWLILPFVVQLMGGIALFVTVVGTKRTSDALLWKGSTLAVLYHSVDKDGVIGSHLRNVEDLEKVEETQVMLEKKDGVSDS
ncbi:uncharacterized protein Triagg1_2733 [Trichoderma aggressivum f. europaeum]|uniref:Uncharacterized protein n=1 Tax=Trichoderma aggressivum f. europaeum TaxID=173218 RepID=A0AAE1IIA8_9HYPO|nr:hypothetical protein Triagg1_2733 [Trichoderma aggressivum f. europaeum]